MSVVRIVKNKLDSLDVKIATEQVLSWLPPSAEAVTGAILAATVSRGCHGQFLGFCGAGVCISRLVPKHQVLRTNSCFLLKCVLIFIEI